MGTLKAILCDIDGTLIDSNDLHVRAWDDVFREAGFTVDRAAIHEQIGKGGDHLVPTLVPDADEATQKKIAERHGAVFKERYIAQARPFPGAHDLLRRLHGEGCKLILATSAKQDELEHYVDLLGVADVITDSVTIDDVARSKPAPDIFATAVAKLDPLPAADMIAIGDTPYDVEAAGKAGVRTIGLLSGGFDRAALSGAIVVYQDVAGLLAGYDASPLVEVSLTAR